LFQLGSEQSETKGEWQMDKIRKAVFPAAGLGTRFLPATKAQPKEMLVLVDKPVIQYGIEEAVAAGLEKMVVVTSRGKSAMEDHFDISFELERVLQDRGKTELLNQVRAVSNMVNISYVRQKEALGLGHAILVARDLVANEPFAILLGDDIIDAEVPCIGQMIDIYEKYQGSVVAIMEVPREEVNRYGIVDGIPLPDSDGRVFQVRSMVEKPTLENSPSNLAIIGRYILTPGIFGLLESTDRGAGGEIQLTDGIQRLTAHEPVFAYKFRGKRFDAGEKMGFLKTTVELALKNKELGGEFRAYLKALNLSEM
jgi:UTP--glucose-1-phosphate uridylyltransferase